jgi:HEAT repeat protein
MSALKRMVQYHIARLGDKNPDVRLKSIKELELLEDTDALEPLRELYDRDENPDVRKAAQGAGRKIFLKNRGEKA